MSTEKVVENSTSTESISEGLQEKYGVVSVVLSDAQILAVMSLDLTDQIEKMATSAFNSALKGKFKYFRDNLYKTLATEYDNAARRGAKWPDSKDEFLKREMKKANDIYNSLL
jgi:hypothetical protein